MIGDTLFFSKVYRKPLGISTFWFISRRWSANSMISNRFKPTPDVVFSVSFPNAFVGVTFLLPALYQLIVGVRPGFRRKKTRHPMIGARFLEDVNRHSDVSNCLTASFPEQPVLRHHRRES